MTFIRMKKSILTYSGWLTLLVLCCFLGACNKQSGGQQYGRKLVAKYTVSAEQIAVFTEFAEQGKNGKPLNPSSSLLAETKDWATPTLQVDKESGPYTVAVTLKGTTRYRGDVSTMWNLGWTVDGGVRSQPFPGLSKLDVKDNQEVTIVKAAAPVRFREKQSVSMVLGLVKMENLNLQSMEVEIWSGVADYTWTEILMSFRWLGLGILLLFLRFFWARR